MDRKIGFLDDCVRPDASDQLLFADDCAGALNQRKQDIQDGTTWRGEFAPLKQKPLHRQQLKWPGRNRNYLHPPAAYGSL
jgi:hypothetical protein